jgi:hypothetical protein
MKQIKRVIFHFFCVILIFLTLGCQSTATAVAPTMPPQTQAGETPPPTTGVIESPTSEFDCPPYLACFVSEGVFVFIDLKSGGPLTFPKYAINPDILKTAKPPEGITPFRVIISFKVLDKDNNEITDFTHFDGMTITVLYTPADLDQAEKAENLVLLILDEKVNTWIPLETHIDTKKKTGTVLITSWNSHLCWGHH